MSLVKAMNLLKNKHLDLQDLLRHYKPMVQDHPEDGETVVEEDLCFAFDAISGWLTESMALLDAGIQSLDLDCDYLSAAKALVACNRRLLLILKKFGSEMITYEHVDELAQLAKDRNGEWPSWSSNVRELLDGLRQLLQELQELTLECWQEIAESVSRKPIQAASA